MAITERMFDRVYIESGIKRLFGTDFIKVEGNWYLIDGRMVRICCSKVFDRSGYKRYFFGIQQKKYDFYRDKDIHVLLICNNFDQALLLPKLFLDDLFAGVPVARDANWKLDIHQFDSRFEILVTGKEHIDVSSYLYKPDAIDIFQPTSDPIILDERVKRIRSRSKVTYPSGNLTPGMLPSSKAKVFERLPAVKAWVLQEAGGICELCQQPGPFILPDGERYLEVHHVRHLADGGPDIVANAVAVCANCHRLLHWAIDADEAIEKLYKQVKRLRKD